MTEVPSSSDESTPKELSALKMLLLEDSDADEKKNYRKDQNSETKEENHPDEYHPKRLGKKIRVVKHFIGMPKIAF